MTDELQDWKARIAEKADQATGHDIVDEAVVELLENLGLTSGGLPDYGIRKVAHYAATVAIAQALGIDPELLRLTSEEAGSEIMRAAAEAAFAGVPVYEIGLEA